MNQILTLLASFLDSISSLGQSSLGITIIFLFIVVVGILAIGKFLESIAKLGAFAFEAVRGYIDWTKSRGQAKQARLRRSQFLRVLDSDLSWLAKAEAWNDQHFTDLEAEVEAEGGFYLSQLRRIFRIRSYGLRRVSSLIRAIDDSTERCLLLVGEPGAGKSVALRHLAWQMIERAKRSPGSNVPIPLYVNLREFSPAKGETPTVDLLTRFVIDNVRRGDADTAEYVQANWDFLKLQGGWFFLFDSFDEIPAVLHSAAMDAAVANYSSAISQFMEGMGECQGVLASREFKSPRGLSWPKLRILPLGESRQEELVSRTFLTHEQKAMVLKHVSTSGTATYTNPLFLTLLCRHARQHNSCPNSEHELLLTHVTQLARRDSRYVLDTWGITGDSLLVHATNVAALLALRSELGLAPTFLDIEQAMREAKGDEYSMTGVLEALSYVKIGRTDVQGHDVSSHRFAFSHRRYQECLFAKLLMETDNIIATEDLVLDSRWREYSLAMLQIGKHEVAGKLLTKASRLISQRIPKVEYQRRKYFGEVLVIYQWNDSEVLHLLSLLQEGLRYRSVDEFPAVAQSVDSIASPLWRRGDYYDRLQVVRYCSAAGRQGLARRLEAATSSRVELLEQAAVHACRYALSPGESLAKWVRLHVAARVVLAKSKFERLKWNALAGEMPQGFEISLPLSRAEKLAKSKTALGLFWYPMEVAEKVTEIAMFRDLRSRGGDGHRAMLQRLYLLGASAFYLGLISLIGGVEMERSATSTGMFCAALLPLILALYFFSRFGVVIGIDHPRRLNISHVAHTLAHSAMRFKRIAGPLLIVFLAFLAPGTALYAAVRLLRPDLNLTWQVVPATSGAFYLALALCYGLWIRIKDYVVEKRTEHSLGCGSDILASFRQCSDFRSIRSACRLLERQTDSWSVTDLRGVVTYMSAALCAIESKSPAQPRWTATGIEVRNCLDSLLGCIDRKEGLGEGRPVREKPVV